MTTQRTACRDNRWQYRGLAKAFRTHSSGAKKTLASAWRSAVALATRAAPDRDIVCAEAVVGATRATATRTPMQVVLFITLSSPRFTSFRANLLPLGRGLQGPPASLNQRLDAATQAPGGLIRRRTGCRRTSRPRRLHLQDERRGRIQLRLGLAGHQAARTGTSCSRCETPAAMATSGGISATSSAMLVALAASTSSGNSRKNDDTRSTTARPGCRNQ